VLAPEHPLVKQLTTSEHYLQVDQDVTHTQRYSEIERSAENRKKTGVFTGTFAINPATGDHIPVWIGDFVLPSYGTGAIMGVPAHDDRDYICANSHYSGDFTTNVHLSEYTESENPSSAYTLLEGNYQLWSPEWSAGWVCGTKYSEGHRMARDK
jgi:leucyl-tRNA synthetase